MSQIFIDISLLNIFNFFQFFDPGEVLYIYESSAGFAILGMRLLGWIWFVYAVIFTMIHYPEKSNFYTKIFLFYSLW